MKRIGIIVALIVAALSLLHARAFATTEFCPATLNIRAVGDAKGTFPPATVYGVELSAYGPRAVSVELAFDTNAGWFAADLPQVTLTARNRTYYLTVGSTVKREWLSPIVYVRFPVNVAISRAWVGSALSRGDGFGWEGQGIVDCLPPPGRLGPVKGLVPLGASTSDLVAMSAPPPAGTTPVEARRTTPLFKTDCAQPFQDARVESAAQPDYPDELRGVWGTFVSDVTVAINADGNLTDAWVSVSSAPAADSEALRAAKRSTYKSAISYCRPVSSLYNFEVTFQR